MAELINSIMDLARCRFGDGLALDRAPVDLEPVLRVVIAELVTAKPDRVVEAHFALPREIDCDRTRVVQLVSNIIYNAMTYGSLDRPFRVHAADGPDSLTLGDGPTPDQHGALPWLPSDQSPNATTAATRAS